MVHFIGAWGIHRFIYNMKKLSSNILSERLGDVHFNILMNVSATVSICNCTTEMYDSLESYTKQMFLIPMDR